MESYSGTIQIAIPVERNTDAPPQLTLKVAFQGCAEAGFCYPPQSRTVTVEPAAPPLTIAPPPVEAAPPVLQAAPAAAPLDLLQAFKSPRAPGQPSQDELLEPDRAFVLSVVPTDPNTLLLRWDIAAGYYLYKDKIGLNLMDAPGVRIQAVDLPTGKAIEDEFFGRQEVYFHQADVITRLQGAVGGRDFALRVAYQGCAETGVCYSPITRILPVTLAAAPAATVPPAVQPASTAPVEAEQDRMARLLIEQRFWALPAFFGFGLLLAFTPCVFPMAPILSSLIVGQGGRLHHRRAFGLSLVYVLAMTLTYTAAGIGAALLGRNIQALLQNPWVLAGSSALFVALALSMFGFYELQLPERWRQQLTEPGAHRRGGNYLGVAGMGVLSALIVSPCVAPPLLGVLTVIAGAGDVVLGGGALFVLSLGMGAPLLLLGASAGRLLPRAGPWMEQIQIVFGVVLLAMALWLLERILPPAVTMLAWAVLLIVCATYMGAFHTVETLASGWRIIVKGLGLVLLVYGILLLVGLAAGGRDVLQPLRGVSFSTAVGQEQPLFRPVKTLVELEQALRRADGRPIMLDFYADWCIACKEMEKYTFSHPDVRARLQDVVLLQADVTANDAAAQELLRHFAIFGPPATLFFGPDGSERKPYRVIGFMPAERFKAHLDQVLGSR